MTRGFGVLMLALAIVWALVLSGAPVAGQAALQRPGDPLPGITPREFDAFRVGLNAFTGVETVDDGLGPAFNGTSCGACHSVPAVGGISPMGSVSSRGVIMLDPSD